jgi:hypothetical protein
VTCSKGRHLDGYCSTSEENWESVTSLGEEVSMVMSSFSLAVEICVTSSSLVTIGACESSQDES